LAYGWQQQRKRAAKVKELLSKHYFESIELKGARVIDPSQGIDAVGDLFIKKGVIQDFTKKGEQPDQKGNRPEKSASMDCSHLVISPSFVDLHSVFSAHGFENLNLASEIGKAGGFSKIALLPTKESPQDQGDFIRSTLPEMDFVPIGGLTKGLQGKELSEIGLMAQNGVQVLSQGPGSLEDAYLMRKALEYASSFNSTIITFPEQKDLCGRGLVHQGWMSTKLGLRGIPTSAEETAVARDLILAKHAEATIHFAQISSEASVSQIRRAKEQGIQVTADVSPEHLFFTESDLENYQTAFKLRPPLRENSDREALLEGLADGTIDAVASHHLPFSPVEKARDFQTAPFGSIGLETAASALFDLVYQEKLSLERALDAISNKSAQILKVEPPRIKVGARAELTCFDLNQEQKWMESSFVGRARNSSFLGKTLKGSVIWTMKGQHCYKR
jgi:dihydroorotase